MSWLSNLFGGGSSAAAEAETVEHEGFKITPTPIREGSEFRICAVIEKEIAGEVKTHKLIRADTVGGLDAAQTASINKAKQLIDQIGEQLFS